ncbi:hypothetical protein [Halocynthiibacter namhaensis]|uniref:hypothetical protein n=1 Tax=Halocynthiibacter namhaensis TaxID=1290553 RepID=UPI00192E6D6E|nr:hypothetical protein [Halocynthiibacter namhaensis]
MKRILLALITTAGLTACGADGAPIRPIAGVGVSVGTGGVSVGGSVGASVGGVNVRVGV